MTDWWQEKDRKRAAELRREHDRGEREARVAAILPVVGPLNVLRVGHDGGKGIMLYDRFGSKLKSDLVVDIVTVGLSMMGYEVP